MMMMPCQDEIRMNYVSHRKRSPRGGIEHSRLSNTLYCRKWSVVEPQVIPFRAKSYMKGSAALFQKFNQILYLISPPVHANEDLEEQPERFACAVFNIDGAAHDVSDIYDCIDNSEFWANHGRPSEAPVGVCCMSRG